MDILEEFEAFKKEKKTPTSKNTKKAVAVLIFISLIMFAKLAPYGGSPIIEDTLAKQIFSLYFFIVNQTLGIVHESGHGICYILHLPPFITALNGTIFQLLFPLGIGYYYKRQGQVFAYLIGLFFFGISLHYTAWYISTAHEGLHLPASKSFLGVDALHDFNYILTQLHLLSYNALIAGFIRFIAYMFMFYASGKMILLAFFARVENSKKKVGYRRTKK